MPPDDPAAADPLCHLPHRDPFRFITRLVSLRPGETGEAFWSPRGDEAFFAGHFPGDPIVPGVLISEALAQLCGLVALHNSEPSRGASLGRLVHVDLRFDNAVRPPTDILLRATLTRSLGQLRQFDVSATVNATPAARGSLSLAAIAAT